LQICPEVEDYCVARFEKILVPSVTANSLLSGEGHSDISVCLSDVRFRPKADIAERNWHVR